MEFNFAFRTDIGQRRQQNQDSGAAEPDLGLFVVADGMGGHRGGEIASQMVTDFVPDYVKKALEEKSFALPSELLKNALLKANQRVFKRAQSEPKLSGMGTTVTAIFFYENKMYIGQVGDSRCYLMRPGGIWQLTRDHSLVQEKLRAGLISREQVKTDQMKNVITRSIGFEHHVVIDLYEYEYSIGDVIMLCSDGLTGQVEDEEILDTANQYIFNAKNITQSVDRLIELANSSGGEDNITSILVQVVSR